MVAISGSTSTTAVNVRGKVMDLLAVLVSDDGTSSGSGVGCQHYSVLYCGFTFIVSNDVFSHSNMSKTDKNN